MPIARHDTGDVRRSLDGRALYICDHCGTLSPWTSDWAWYGSYMQMENIGLPGVPPVQTICSAACRVAMVAVGRLPADGLDDRGEVDGDERSKLRCTLSTAKESE